jgi:hypothetical protein
MLAALDQSIVRPVPASQRVVDVEQDERLRRPVHQRPVRLFERRRAEHRPRQRRRVGGRLVAVELDRGDSRLRRDACDLVNRLVHEHPNRDHGAGQLPNDGGMAAANSGAIYRGLFGQKTNPTAVAPCRTA